MHNWKCKSKISAFYKRQFLSGEANAWAKSVHTNACTNRSSDRLSTSAQGFSVWSQKQQIRLYFVLNLHESWEQSRDNVAGKNLP